MAKKTPNVSEEDKEVLHGFGYEIGTEAGSGFFGVVYNGVCNQWSSKNYVISEKDVEVMSTIGTIRRTSTQILVEKSLYGKRCAIKWLSCGATPSALKEAKVLEDLKHPNIVEIYSVLTTPIRHRYIVMEYINGGTLSKLLSKAFFKYKLSEEEVHSIFEQIISGLSYLHSKDICHYDFHPGNIMIQINDWGQPHMRLIKIIDFGLVKVGKLYDPIKGVDLDYGFDIYKMGIVFRRTLDEATIKNPSLSTELDSLIKRITKREFINFNVLMPEILPLLDRMQKLQPSGRPFFFRAPSHIYQPCPIS